MPRRNYALENYRDGLAAIRVIREAVETLGVDALRKMLANNSRAKENVGLGAQLNR